MRACACVLSIHKQELREGYERGPARIRQTRSKAQQRAGLVTRGCTRRSGTSRPRLYSSSAIRDDSGTHSGRCTSACSSAVLNTRRCFERRSRQRQLRRNNRDIRDNVGSPIATQKQSVIADVDRDEPRVGME